MATIERLGEGLARRMDRRHVLKRTAAAVFGVTAAFATRGFSPDRALASACGAYDTGCYCNPAGGTYCTAYDYNYCSGANCNTPCSAYTRVYPYTGGCWCTTGCNYGSGTCGYYMCCDCSCPEGLCGCRQFVNTYPQCPSRVAA